MANSAYQPLQPARRPGGKPADSPNFRVLVHRQYYEKYKRLEEMIGLQQAQELWDHLAMTPDQPPKTGSCVLLKGKAGDPHEIGWSRKRHYEASSKVRVDYEFNREFKTAEAADPHPVCAIMTISFSSH